VFKTQSSIYLLALRNRLRSWVNLQLLAQLLPLLELGHVCAEERSEYLVDRVVLTLKSLLLGPTFLNSEPLEVLEECGVAIRLEALKLAKIVVADLRSIGSRVAGMEPAARARVVGRECRHWGKLYGNAALCNLSVAAL
jgi:hypothetical protein